MNYATNSKNGLLYNCVHYYSFSFNKILKYFIVSTYFQQVSTCYLYNINVQLTRKLPTSCDFNGLFNCFFNTL